MSVGILANNMVVLQYAIKDICKAAPSRAKDQSGHPVRNDRELCLPSLSRCCYDILDSVAKYLLPQETLFQLALRLIILKSDYLPLAANVKVILKGHCIFEP